MLIEFFLKLKEGGVPASIREFLTLLEALEKRVIFGSLDDFYQLARVCLVKDEKYYDRYDRVFAAYFKGIIDVEGLTLVIPEEWLKKLAEKVLTEEEKKAHRIAGRLGQADGNPEEAAGGAEGRHQGGGKWIGTAGTSPTGLTATTRRACVSDSPNPGIDAR